MISVIVPVYKVEPYLRQCLDSIVNQTYTDLEILLIDDGSPDKCGEICDEYAQKDSRIRVFHTENHGLSAARNLGLREAKGEYIGFVDSDDWIEPDMYKALLDKLKETDSDISECSLWYEYLTSSLALPLKEIIYSGEEILRALLDGNINDYIWNKLYCRGLFKSISFPIGMNYEDTAIIHKLMFKSKKVAVIQTLGYHYRKRQESITNTYTAKNVLDYAESHLYRYYFIKENSRELFLEKKDELLRFTAVGISKVWRWWFYCGLGKKEYEESIKELVTFSKTHYPLLGIGTWPLYLRYTSAFMHSNSIISFALLYFVNRIYQKLYPYKANCFNR